MLFIVPTPIGNLEDITKRAERILGEAEIILCEDSRMTRKLLTLLNITHKPKFIDLTKNHLFNEVGVESALKLALEEKLIVLVSDAGMPGLSDPGFEVIKLAQLMKIPYTVLPGPDATIPAVVASGLVGKEFWFKGFLPIKKGRQTAWKEIADCAVPVVIYESVHRIQKLIEECQLYLKPERKLCICKDISKLYEKIWVGSVVELTSFELVEKGEFVIVIEKS